MMTVMTTFVKRDRDDVGTHIPVLIPTAGNERRDGVVTRSEDVVDEKEGSAYHLGDIPVKMVPFKAIAELLSATPKRKGTAWRLEDDDRLELIALTMLVDWAAKRDRSKLKSFVKIQSDLLGRDADIVLVNKWTESDRIRVALSQAKSAFRVIGNKINCRLKNARFVIWWVEEQRHFAPGLLCQDVHTAVIALLVSRMTSSQNFAVCALPSCRNRFVRVKRNNRYCSRKCGDTHRKQLQRSQLRRAQKRRG